MKGDVWECPTCRARLIEADCVYTEAVCRRTGECRRSRGGGTQMQVTQKAL